MTSPRINIDQWLVFQAVVDEGSFANAAEKLNRSQSTISYNISQLQSLLGLKLLIIDGRKAVLTEAGRQILNRSRQITRIAKDVELSAKNLQAGLEEKIDLCVDSILPKPLLLAVLKKFGDTNKQTRLIISEGILSGPTEAIQNGHTDIAITSKIPNGFIGEQIIDIESVAYAHVDSPLHRLGRNITDEDLQAERYIVAMDSGVQSERNEGWHGSENLWKVDSIDMKVKLVAANIGFSWLPRLIVEALNLPLKPLPLASKSFRKYPLYLVSRNPGQMGPSSHKLMQLLKETCDNYSCSGATT